MPAGAEALRLDHRDGLGKTVRQSSRVVGVTPERDRTPALVTPPLHDLRNQPRASVHFKNAVAARESAQGPAEVAFESGPVKSPHPFGQ